jgi:arylsulfatase A-like enzyme
MDIYLENLIEKLDSLEVRNNTIIIITADHGEEFYEHGGFTHSTTLYEEAIHVPLIIYYPQKFSAKRIETPVMIFDVFATLLEILEINVESDAKTLIPVIEEDLRHRDFIHAELVAREYLSSIPENEEADQKAAIFGSWKIIEVGQKTEGLPSSLFFLKNDPQEQRNLYNEQIDKREDMKQRIAEIINS